MRITWRVGIGAAIALLLGASLPPSAKGADGCETLRGETVTLIVPFPAGGGYDQYARLLDPYLEKATGAEIVVSNVGGAGGLIGAKQIRDAAPDGKTLGVMSGNILLIQRTFGETDVPSPTDDFTLLGQLSEDSMVWVVPASSPITSVDSLWERTQPMVAGATGGGTSILLTLAGGATLAGINAEYVGGYRGSRDVTMALMRGELDVTALSYESAVTMVQSGEMRAILFMGDEPLPQDSALHGVPVTGGSDGIAARRASAVGRSSEEAQAMASSLSEILRERRVFVAPAGLKPDVAECLERSFLEVAASAEFAAELQKAGRELKPLGRAELMERLGKAEEAARALAPMAQEAAKRLRS